MGERAPSAKREQTALAARLRTAGKSWPEIAAVFRERYRVNARVALRLVHGLSQRDVAEEWSRRWPEEPISLKRVSYWEQWPSATGQQPPLNALSRLAEIYQCGVADLLVDCGDFRHLDPCQGSTSTQGTRQVPLPAPSPDEFLPAGFPLPLSSQTLQLETPFLLSGVQRLDFTELARTLSMWAERFNPALDRRALLFKLSSAFAVAAAAPVFDRFTPDDRARITGVVTDPSRLDAATLAHAEQIVQDCRRQGDVLGPQVTLQSVLAERQVIQNILASGPSAQLLPRAMSVYAELSQLAGWRLFNLGDYRAANYYYDDARTSAHDAHNVELVTYVLCSMSHLATWQGKPRVGIDHAVAAQSWADRSGSAQARAYAGDVAARALAADGQWSACRQALDDERAALAQIGPSGSPAANWWYFYDESFYWGTESECALLEGDSKRALETTAKSLQMIDSANLHDYAATLTFQSEALILEDEVDEACRILGDVARLTVVNTSRRIDQRLTVLRGRLDRWQGSQSLTDLDETLRLYRRAEIGSGSTNKS